MFLHKSVILSTGGGGGGGHAWLGVCMAGEGVHGHAPLLRLASGRYASY